MPASEDGTRAAPETLHRDRRNSPRNGMPLGARDRNASRSAARAIVLRHRTRLSGPRRGMVFEFSGRLPFSVRGGEAAQLSITSIVASGDAHRKARASAHRERGQGPDGTPPGTCLYLVAGVGGFRQNSIADPFRTTLGGRTSHPGPGRFLNLHPLTTSVLRPRPRSTRSKQRAFRWASPPGRVPDTPLPVVAAFQGSRRGRIWGFGDISTQSRKTSLTSSIVTSR